MANLTIRKLDDAIRDELRLRAARNGRSVEDEVRVILREAAQNHPSLATPAPRETSRTPPAPHPAGSTG
jgi:phosphopantothenoylcysteine decarboxylase/phosphopantothenate--cysteine ligase